MPQNNPDVIVIGAGIIGSSIALELSKKGFRHDYEKEGL